MLSKEEAEFVAPAIRTTQLIWLALLAGTVLGTLICGLIALANWQKVNANFDPLSAIGVGVGLMLAVQAMIVPGMVAKSAISYALRTEQPSRLRALARVFQSQSIIQFAMLEGGAFMNLLFFFVNRNLYCLAYAAFAAALLAVRFPSTDGANTWIANRLPV